MWGNLGLKLGTDGLSSDYGAQYKCLMLKMQIIQADQ